VTSIIVTNVGVVEPCDEGSSSPLDDDPDAADAAAADAAASSSFSGVDPEPPHSELGSPAAAPAAAEAAAAAAAAPVGRLTTVAVTVVMEGNGALVQSQFGFEIGPPWHRSSEARSRPRSLCIPKRKREMRMKMAGATCVVARSQVDADGQGGAPSESGLRRRARGTIWARI